MSYTTQQETTILKMASEGKSSRKIASKLNISKSGVNYFLARQEDLKSLVETDKHKPKILVFDLETAAAVALTFGRFKVNLSQSNIVTEGGWILCVAYRWLGEDKIHTLQLTQKEVSQQDDSRLIAALWELYEEADAVVAHNALHFDHKVLQGRAAVMGFPPLPLVKVLDTLVLAKKHMRLPSNRLDAIGEHFGLGRKIETGGITLWKRVQEGDAEAMKEMVTYCKQDTELLTKVYLRLRAIGHAGSDFNASLYYPDDETRCRRCGSTDIHETGRKSHTGLSSFDEYRCDSCGAVQRARTSSTTKEKRKTLLT